MSSSESPLDYCKAPTIMTKWGSPLSRQRFVPFFPLFCSFFSSVFFWKEKKWKLPGPMKFFIPLSPHPTPDFLGGHIKSDLPCSAQNFTCVIFAKEFCLLDILERSVNCTTGFSPLLLAISDWSVALTFISTVPALLYSDLRSKPHRSQKLFLLTPQVLDQSFFFIQGCLRPKQQLYSNRDNSLKKCKCLLFSTFTSNMVLAL